MKTPSADTLNRLANIKGFVFDMDGTLILGDKKNSNMKALPGAVEFTTLLNERGIPWTVMTNGTVRSARQYVPVLQGAGIPLTEQKMMTPSSVAADFFVREGMKRVMVLGCPGVWEPLKDVGIEVVLSSKPDPGDVDAVYIGWYREFGFVDLEAAYKAVAAGAPLYTASDVPFFATANGPGIGTSCAIAAALKPLTGVQATVLGKPSQEVLKAASRRLNVDISDMAVIGDDAELEVPMPLAGGAMALYVESGTSGANAFVNKPENEHPHIQAENVGGILEYYLAS